jgi:hypothetical protein
MMSLIDYDAFAISRGEGLHPKLRDLLERPAAFPSSEGGVRGDGMVQAGPDPRSENLTSSRNLISLKPNPEVEIGTRCSAPPQSLPVRGPRLAL